MVADNHRVTKESPDQAHVRIGPIYHVASPTGSSSMRAIQVIEMLRINAQNNAKDNLKMSVHFRAVAERFKEWAQIAEPGWLFMAPMARLVITRGSAAAPPYLVDPHGGGGMMIPQNEQVGPDRPNDGGKT